MRDGEQTRALYPAEEGFIERDGVRIFWEAYGEGESTVLLLPTWSLLHSRFWKAQIHYLARHFRVVTFDGRGNGRSDRPDGLEAYAESEFAADALEVMDATGTERATIAGLSMGTQRGLLLAAEHPERVDAAAFIGPWFPASRLHGLRWRLMAHPRMAPLFEHPLPTARWWLKFNGAHWRRDYDDFVRWFVGRCLPEPHSTKQIEDGVGWAKETDPKTLALTALAAPGRAGRPPQPARPRPAPALPGAGDPRPPRSDQPPGRWTGPCAGDRRAATWSSPTPGTCPRPASRSRSTSPCESLPRAGARARVGEGATRPCAGRTGGVALSTSPRRSASATPSATWRSPRSCETWSPTWRSTGSRRIRSPGFWSGRGRRSTRPAPTWPTSPITSSRSRPSTICTASRRGGGWTRS